MRIQLSKQDQEFAARFARYINDRGERLYGRSTKDYTGDTLRARTYAFCAEFALARWADLSWPNPENTFAGPDVGFWGQVKFTFKPPGERVLFVNTRSSDKRDPESYAWVLMVGGLDEFEVAGWIGGTVLCAREPVENRGETKWNMAAEELRTDFDVLRSVLGSAPLPVPTRRRPTTSAPRPSPRPSYAARGRASWPRRN